MAEKQIRKNLGDFVRGMSHSPLNRLLLSAPELSEERTLINYQNLSRAEFVGRFTGLVLDLTLYGLFCYGVVRYIGGHH